MDYARVRSYAKINLTLDLLGVSGGFHLLDSVVASVDLSDGITVKKRRDRLITVEMHGMGSESIPYEDNNAARAAERFVEAFSTYGADVTVHKNIPMGAGLGGSSADAAGVLNALAKLYGVTDFKAIKSIADGLGSDTGYMLTGGFARLFGRGERVQPIESDLRLDIGLIVPKGGVSTGECYKLSDALEGSPHTSAGASEALKNNDLQALGKNLSNGLYGAATRLNSGVEAAYKALADLDPVGVNMTGSGSGVYAIFQNRQFLEYAASRIKQFKLISTRTVGISR